MSDQAKHQAVVEATADAEANMRTQTVPVNVYETSEAVVVIAPLPGVQPDDVTVELRGRQLRFWAHLRSAAPRDYLVHEWDYGGYEREVDVPEGYGGGIEATLGNGQIAIRVLSGEAPSEGLSVQPRSA